MDAELKKALLRCETDLDGALYRFGDDEELYIRCLKAFLNDPTLIELDQAISSESWDEAFTAAHALKGVAGNMGFIPLFHAVAELVVLIRKGRVKEVGRSFTELTDCYSDITDVIRQYCAMGGTNA